VQDEAAGAPVLRGSFSRCASRPTRHSCCSLSKLSTCNIRDTVPVSSAICIPDGRPSPSRDKPEGHSYVSVNKTMFRLTERREFVHEERP